MAKATKSVERKPSVVITDFFQRKSGSLSSKQTTSSPMPSKLLNRTTGTLRPASAVGGVSGNTILSSFDSELSSASSRSMTPDMSPSRASRTAERLMSPMKPASKRKAKFDLDSSDMSQISRAATIYVRKSCPGTTDGRNASTPTNHKRARFSSSPKVPSSQDSEEEVLLATTDDRMDTSRPSTPQRNQQHTPPPMNTSVYPPGVPFTSPGTLKTQKILEDIRRHAAAAAREISSPETTPPPTFNDRELSDSSDEDDTDIVRPEIKGKAPASLPATTPTTRYPLRNRVSPSSSQTRTLKVPAQGPVLIASKPKQKKSDNPIAGMLREKKLADKKNVGEDGRREAEAALLKKHMYDEMEGYGSDEEVLLRVGTDPFELLTPPGEDTAGSPNGAKLLGDERGKAVDSIIESDRRKEVIAQMQEQTLGVPLWKGANNSCMDSNLSPPSFAMQSHIFKMFSSALSHRDYTGASMFLDCGMLLHHDLQRDPFVLSYISSLALKTPDRLPRSAIAALLNVWSLPETSIPGFSPQCAITALHELGAEKEVMERLGWNDPRHISPLPIENRIDVVREIVHLITESARFKRTLIEDIPDSVMVLSIIALEPGCSNEDTRLIIDALDTLCHAFPTQRTAAEHKLYSKVLAYLLSLKPVNQAHLLSLFASGSSRSQRVSRILAHFLLTNTPLVPDSYSNHPSLASLIDVLSSTHETASYFKINNETNYVAMGYHVQIATFALTDIEGYVRQERLMDLGPKEQTSPKKAEKFETPLEILRAAVERLHSKIIDTRAAHLDRSRLKQSLKSLSMRIHYQHTSAARSSNHQGQKNLAQYFNNSNATT